MRIFEISNENLIWLSLKNINISELNDRYDNMIILLNFLVKQKSKHRNLTWIFTVDEFLDELNDILNAYFPDMQDQDIIDFIEKLNLMKSNIENLKSKLTF